jgi:radical SAM superfamily enzyme YgiQ (UPF0313 family)
VKILYLPNQYSQQRQRQKKRWIYPVRLAMEATYNKILGHDVSFDLDSFDYRNFDKCISKPEGIPFINLPYPDRFLTKAFDKKYMSNGNFKYRPGVYILTASGCWYGKCEFCVERKEKYVCRSVDSVLAEIAELSMLGFREVFDDSGTFPDGEWLKEFCHKKINLGLNIPISCNMRIGAKVDFKLMKSAGFRMLLYGIESASQETLDRIKKGIRYEDIIPTIKQASEAGLEPHVAGMLSYPWGSKEDDNRTISLICYLLKKGYAKTAQVSLYTSDDYRGKGNVKGIYKVALSPEFWYNKIKDIRSREDLYYLFRSIKEALSV